MLPDKVSELLASVGLHVPVHKVFPNQAPRKFNNHNGLQGVSVSMPQQCQVYWVERFSLLPDTSKHVIISPK